MVDEATDGDGDDGPEESGVVKDLKRQIAKINAKIEEQSEAIRAEVTRELSAKKILSDLGHPKMAELAREDIEGDLTEEAATEWLSEKWGLEPRKKAKAPRADETTASVTETRGIPTFGDRVAALARGEYLGLDAELEAADRATGDPVSYAKAIRKILDDRGLPTTGFSTDY